MGSFDSMRREARREEREKEIKKAAAEEWEQKALDTLAGNFVITPELAKKIKDYGGYIPWSTETIYKYTQTVTFLKEENRLIRESRNRKMAELNESLSLQAYVILARVEAHADIYSVHAAQSPETVPDVTTMLAVHAMRSDVRLVKSTLDKGAKVNAFSVEGTWLLPLSAAAIGGSVAVMDLLLNAGAKVNAKVDNMTALTWAAWSQHLDVAELLLDRGAYINVNYNRREKFLQALTPLRIAEYTEAWDVVRLLKERGAKGKLSLQTKRKLRA